MLIHRQFRLGERTPEEVTAFLRKIDWNENPGALRIWRGSAPCAFIRAIATSAGSCGYASIKRSEFIARMYHNVRVVHEWANTEVRLILEKPHESWTDHERQIMALAAEAAQFQNAGPAAAHSAFHLDGGAHGILDGRPSIAALRRCGPGGETDLIELYRSLQNQQLTACLAHGLSFQ